ncbi:hypothetical protein HYY71_01485 [Candidatus Woesearchaeota archaeon]|nr:hypothetical protein [Candidatus Woesearchaeota archaeon]
MTLTKLVYLEGERVYSRNGEYKWDTGKGRFVPSSLDGIKYGLEQLIAKGILCSSIWFCDAGAGDYRVVAISSALGIPSIGVEYDGALVQIGESNIRQLRSLGVINGAPLIVAQGNFKRDRTYKRNGSRFEEIGAFFNFINNDAKIARKIARQSPSGTWFVLETIAGIWKKEFTGLDYVDTIGADIKYGLCRDLQLYRKP